MPGVVEDTAGRARTPSVTGTGTAPNTPTKSRRLSFISTKSAPSVKRTSVTRPRTPHTPVTPITPHHHSQFDFEFIPNTNKIVTFDVAPKQEEEASVGFDFNEDVVPGIAYQSPSPPLTALPEDDTISFHLPWEDFEQHDRIDESVEEMYAEAVRTSIVSERFDVQSVHSTPVPSSFSGSADASSGSDNTKDSKRSRRRLSGIASKLTRRRRLE